MFPRWALSSPVLSACVCVVLAVELSGIFLVEDRNGTEICSGVREFVVAL